MNKIIEIKNLYFSYNHIPILENINLEVEEGEFLGIIGPNGGGKSTLFKIIVGLLKPTSGEVKVFGKNSTQLKEERKWLGYVAQKPDLEKYLPLKVREIVALGRKVFKDWKKLTKEDFNVIEKVMEELEIETYTNNIFSELSGGEQQRVLIAKAITQEPKILLLDEPTVGIDIKIQNKFYSLLETLNSKGITILLVSHDVGIITNKAKKIACMNKKIYLHGCPDDIKTYNILKELYGEEFLFLTHKED
ncbi:MAG TPA: metal ABC transporter ATP-binding protein [Dictyoglomaceae bacterium]|nr:metal ABC transporter ATP-binding protein [Dictyoglomaceae bacterium]HOL39367.1 metal ABC transporter ATP-binding protein [Dictyoglomaceae bacterium]HOP94818.1 metal ABC transporter ATP-binding protein [Dictyoglomaceae bacterium]HPP15951.1 metal ABC transporter ATP-binding protein [Dictyoglomaceae bacterium]HPU43287.1 metal ABC transporter ATP-binding protein [Dictyoglomaceae bacterium]